MKARVGRSFVVAVAMSVFAGTLAWMAAPSLSADPCPEGVSGHWSGSGLTGTGIPFTIDAEITFDGTSMSGTVSAAGGTPGPFSGTVDCADITFGTVSPATTFTGTLASDGRSASGTYTLGSDTGTWTNAYDPLVPDEYELVATSILQPTTIAPGAATSWFIDVENVGAAAAADVQVDFTLSGSGELGSLSDTSTSQGTGCFEDAGQIHCDIGTLLPGQTESAQVKVVSTGGAGTQISADGFAASLVGGGTNDFTSTVTISVVAPTALPPGEASGIAQPGVTFATPGKVTEANPIVVKFKLPRKVAAGTTSALALSPARSKQQRFIDGASLVSYRRGGAKHQARPTKALALGRPRAAMVSGPPVPMSISRIASEATTFCGGAACSGDVIHLTSFSGYNDRKKPAKVTITWDASVRGRGTGSSIYKRGDSTTSTLRTLPTCVKVPKLGYSNLPCVSKKKQLGSGDVQFIILMLSGDPKFGRR